MTRCSVADLYADSSSPKPLAGRFHDCRSGYDRDLTVPLKPTGILIEYARFVEVQQRRARITALLNEVRETPAPHMSRSAFDEVIEMRKGIADAADLKTCASAMPVPGSNRSQ